MVGKKIILLAVTLMASLAAPAGLVLADDGLVSCGRGTDMCTLCDLVKGFVDVANYGMEITGVLAVVALVAGGVMYVVSGGNSGMTSMAKEAMKKALIGTCIVLLSYVMVNVLLMAISETGSFIHTDGAWATYSCT